MNGKSKFFLIYEGIKFLGKKIEINFHFLFFISMIIETLGVGMFIPLLSFLTQDGFNSKLNNLMPFLNFSNYSNQDLIKYTIIMLIVFTIRGLFLYLISHRYSSLVICDRIFELKNKSLQLSRKGTL